jgi:hypothetical protein
MLRRSWSIALLTMLAVALVSPVSASPAGPEGAEPPMAPDHLGGAFTVCGRLIDFTAPMVGTPGSLTVAGVVDGADHVFPIDESATIDALVTPLAAAAEWTCLDLVGDGMGVITSATVASTTSCGVLSLDAGMLTQQPGTTHEFTTVALDGDAGTIIAADADLALLLEAVATVSGAAEACLDFVLAADGTLATVALDYALTPGGDLTAPVACGAVDGTPVPYRDPASQVYPEGTTVSVGGVAIDASLVDGPFHSVLSFHLDAGRALCLLARVVDSVIVETAVLTGGASAEVCGELEVIGGLVFVDTVVVPQGLTGINFAAPTPASIASACMSARAQEAAATGDLVVCGDFDAVAATTFTVSGVTFHLETSIDATEAPSTGGPQAIGLQGPDPFQPFGPTNPARLVAATLDGCAAAPSSPAPALPDTVVAPASGAASPLALLIVATTLASSGALTMAVVRARRR